MESFNTQSYPGFPSPLKLISSGIETRLDLVLNEAGANLSNSETERTSVTVAYECHICFSQFLTKPALDAHQRAVCKIQSKKMNISSDNRQPSVRPNFFKCPSCLKRFLTMHGLQNHRKGKADCVKQLNITKRDAGKTLWIHSPRSLSDPTPTKDLKEKYVVFQCEVCHIGLNCRSKILEHMQQFHSLTHVCCGLIFTNGLHVEHHKSTKHNNAEISRLTKTQSTFDQSMDLSTERVDEINHTAKRPYCQNCNKVFENVTKRDEHLLSVHGRRYKHKCSACKSTFASNQILKRHVKRVHLKERAFKCLFCDDSFFSSRELTEHSRSHLGQKLKCHLCPATFYKVSCLNRHEKSHR